MSNPRLEKSRDAHAASAASDEQDARAVESRAPESRVDQILTEAARLFRDKGFAGASMSELARTVGVSKPALYHHFASKEELFVAVAVREPQAAADEMKAVAADPSLQAAEKLRRLVELSYGNIVDSMAGQMMHTIAETSSRFPQIARRFRDGFIADQIGALTRIVEDGIASGEFKPTHAEFLCQLAFGPPMMVSLTRSMYGDLDDSPQIDVEALKERHYAALMKLLA